MSRLCEQYSTTEAPGWRHVGSLWLCPGQGIGVRLACPAGRPDAEGGPYCGAHGGHARALEVAQSDWSYLAPASVGDAKAVLDAGLRSLSSEHVYVVVRPCTFSGVWLVWLGLGSHLAPVPRPDYDGCGRPGCRSCREGLGCGRRKHAHPSLEAARAAGVAAWRENLTRTVEEIRAQRGGTLAWGAPIEPREEPTVLVLDEHGSAWDAVVRRGRK